MSDMSQLKIIGKKSGGNYFNISKQETSLEDILNAIPEFSNNLPLSYLGYSINSVPPNQGQMQRGESVDIYPNSAEIIVGKRFGLAGFLNSQYDVEVVIQYGFGATVVKRLE